MKTSIDKPKGTWWIGYSQSFNPPQMRYGAWSTVEELFDDLINDSRLRFYHGDMILRQTPSGNFVIKYRRRGIHWQKINTYTEYDADKENC